MGKGVKNTIKDIIPQEWEHVLRENKVLTNFCEYVYRDVVPLNWRNYKNGKNAVNRIKHLTSNCAFLNCFNFNDTKEGTAFWLDINEKIIIFKDQSR